MSSEVFILVEGDDLEWQIIDSLKTCFYNDLNIKLKSKVILIGAFGTSIYGLYKETSNDPDLDLFGLIKEKGRKKIDDLENERLKNNKQSFSEKQQKIVDHIKNLLEYKVANVSEVFLFFDYDSHCTNADDLKIDNMLKLFNEETEFGKLYLSYPMVEAIKHIDNDCFKDKVDIAEKCYKTKVNRTCLEEYKHFNDYDINTWRRIIKLHLQKMNYIVNDIYDLPSNNISQRMIFKCQKTKYIDKLREDCKVVAVLSAFPPFLYDYFTDDVRSIFIG
ncbi:hypothetical protein K4L44_16845 [Halosquirtibacter laminarini]|uniref:Uncharacterized protein n=1 Tax=Halosquirtibacter laminarini TaxID=3374600 RepID=A0AC61NF63_9BACT|nr:hypothetical protein K4L44_16845 [Prolixibacteraceae bacterium]